MSATANNLGHSELLRNSKFFGELMITEILAEMRKPEAANSGDLSKDKLPLKPHLSPAMLNSSLYKQVLPPCPSSYKKRDTWHHKAPFSVIHYSTASWRMMNNRKLHNQSVFSPHTTCLHSPMEDKAGTMSCALLILDLSSGTAISYQHPGLGENYPSLLLFHLSKGFG